MITVYNSMLEFLQTVIAGDRVIEYGYPRVAKKLSNGAQGSEHFAYELTEKSVRPAVGQRIMSTSDIYTVVVQADYAVDCSQWITILLRATEGTNVQFISSSVRKEPGVETGHIGTCVLSIYNVS